MDKTYKFIRMEKDVRGEKFGGRDVYMIVNRKSNIPIANVFWYLPWGQWVARFDDNSVWSDGCLADVRDFLQVMNKGAST